IGDSWRGFLTSSCPETGQDSIFDVTLTDKTIENINGTNLNAYKLTYSSPNLGYTFTFKFYQLFGTLYGSELNEFDNCDFMEAMGTTTNCFLYHEGGNDEFLYHRNP